MMRRTVLTAVTVAIAAYWGASLLSAQERKDIRIGFLPGPYADQFKRAIQPQLEARGYKITAIELPELLQLNARLLDGTLEVNIFQTKGFMDLYNSQHKADLTEVLRIPTAPIGLYSDKVKSMADIRSGMSISIPADPTSMSRSLQFLQSLDLIKIDPAVDITRATDKNVVENVRKLKLVPTDAPQLPRSLAEVDLSTPLGNHVIAAGRLLSSALVLEDPAPRYQTIIVTRAAEANSARSKDLVEAYRSDVFKQFIQSDPKTKGFSTPPYWR